MREVDSIAHIDTPNLYAYRLRRDGIIRQPFSKLKADSAVQVAEQMRKDFDCWYPDLSLAVSSRIFSLCRMVFAQIPISCEEYEKEKRDLWAILQAESEVVKKDRLARKREKLAASVAGLGMGAFGHFCHVCRMVGFMR